MSASECAPAASLLAPETQCRSRYRATGYADLGLLWLAVELLNDAVLLAALVGLAVRYRRGDERLRQLLWLILAVLVVAVLLPLWGIYQLTPVLALLLIALVPAAMTVAHQDGDQPRLDVVREATVQRSRRGRPAGSTGWSRKSRSLGHVG